MYDIINKKIKMIADFMEVGMISDKVFAVFIPDISSETKFLTIEELKFDTDLNWQLAVLKKISRLGKKCFGTWALYDDRCIINCYLNECREHNIDVMGQSNVDCHNIFNAIILFIEWYNENKGKIV